MTRKTLKADSFRLFFFATLCMLVIGIGFQNCAKNEEGTPGAAAGPDADTPAYYCGEFVSASGTFHPTLDEKAQGKDCYDLTTNYKEAGGYDVFKTQVRKAWRETTDLYCSTHASGNYVAPAYFRIFQKTKSGKELNEFKENDSTSTCPAAADR